MSDCRVVVTTQEWIELYNSDSSDVDLSGWKLQDQQGTITTYTIPNGTKISADGYLIFRRPDTKIMLNNDVDGLNLLTPDSKTIDTVSYTKAPLGLSYNKTSPGWQWSSTLTPGAKNTITVVEVKNNTKTLSKAKNSDNSKIAVADISQAINTNQEETKITNPWFLFFTVLATTIILAIVVLFIKLKLNKNPSG